MQMSREKNRSEQSSSSCWKARDESWKKPAGYSEIERDGTFEGSFWFSKVSLYCKAQEDIFLSWHRFVVNCTLNHLNHLNHSNQLRQIKNRQLSYCSGFFEDLVALTARCSFAHFCASNFRTVAKLKQIMKFTRFISLENCWTVENWENYEYCENWDKRWEFW